MIPIKDDHDGSKRTTWRLRKTRRPSWTSGASRHGADELPVFLASTDQPAFLPMETDHALADRRKRFALASRQFQTDLHARYLASKERITALRQRARLSSMKLPDTKFQGDFARFGLIMLVLPIVLLFMSDRSLRPEKESATASAQQVPPKFDLGDRLAFAENFRDQLVSRGITSSFEPTPSHDAENNQPPALTEQTSPQQQLPEADTSSDTSAPSFEVLTPTTMDGRQPRLPYDSKTYVHSALPTTAAASFRAEIAVSELMSHRTEVATNEIADDTPAPVLKRAVQKRKKAITQKRRPQTPNQMTASSAPTQAATPQQPNLPPPPILFFLGAPPPQQSPTAP